MYDVKSKKIKFKELEKADRVLVNEGIRINEISHKINSISNLDSTSISNSIIHYQLKSDNK